MLTDLALFAAAWLLAAMSPGPNALISIDASIRIGWPRSFAVVAGIATMSVLYGTLAVNILDSILIIAPGIFNAVITAGAFYLLYLAWRILRRAPLQRKDAQSREAAQIKKRRLFLLGFTTSLANPQALLAYLSFFPAIIHADSVPGPAIVATASAIVLVVYSIYSMFAYGMRQFITAEPIRQKAIDAAAAACFLAFAVKNLYYVSGTITAP